MTNKSSTHFSLTQPELWQKKLAVLLAVTAMCVIFSCAIAGWSKSPLKHIDVLEGPANEKDRQRTMQMLVYAKNLDRGAVLQSADYSTVELTASELPFDAINYDSIAEGRTLKMSVKQGDLIKLRDLGIALNSSFPPRIPFLNVSTVPLPLLLAARQITKGSVITYSDLEIKKIAMNKIPAHSLVSPYAAVGRIVSGNIEKAAIIYERDVSIECHKSD